MFKIFKAEKWNYCGEVSKTSASGNFSKKRVSPQRLPVMVLGLYPVFYILSLISCELLWLLFWVLRLSVSLFILIVYCLLCIIFSLLQLSCYVWFVPAVLPSCLQVYNMVQMCIYCLSLPLSFVYQVSCSHFLVFPSLVFFLVHCCLSVLYYWYKLLFIINKWFIIC